MFVFHIIFTTIFLSESIMTAYLDCNATAPMEPVVADVVIRYMTQEFGNAGSRTHSFGSRAKQAVENAREQVARVVAASKGEVYFTSGATESNNIAILGLENEGNRTGKKHIITTSIEHKAVLEPCEHLASKGFEITYLKPDSQGRVSAKDLGEVLREDTLLVSIMQVNNETGVVQPIEECAEVLADHGAFFHVDAAQGFGKIIEPLALPRIDLISMSAHKLYGPKGIGALIARRRGYKPLPLSPLLFGGGQEKGLRPGTHPVHLIVGLGKAAEIALKDYKSRLEKCLKIRNEAMSALAELNPKYHGAEHSIAHTINFSVEGVNSEAAIVALKGIAAVSNGSACTSQSYTLSHVLASMGLPKEEIMGALRVSWCHMTKNVNWSKIVDALKELQ